MMNVAEILYEIEALACPKMRAQWERMTLADATSCQYFGVGLTKLHWLAKMATSGLGRDAGLAKALWDSGIHDARLLSTMIDQPRLIAVEELNRRADQIPTWDLADKFAQYVVAKHPKGSRLAWQQLQEDRTIPRRLGLMTAFELARVSKDLPDKYFEAFLNIIHERLEAEPNWIVKGGMIIALMGVGARNAVLNQKALKIAQSHPGIQVKVGLTSRKTPDYLAYLQSEKVRNKINAARN